MQNKTKQHLKEIIRILAEAKGRGESFLWIRELSRRCKLNPATVTWCIHRYLLQEIEFVEVEPLIEKGLKIQPIRIKEEIYQKLLKQQNTS